MFTDEEIIDQTKKWITDVVIGCNFCPFAANVVKQQRIHYQVENRFEPGDCMDLMTREMARLDDEITIETIFLILPNSFQQFADYLNLASDAEELLISKGYEGIYQLASFHPLYLFEGSEESDAANYTNRSIYPMLHLLRESSIDKALEHYNQPEDIPLDNIDFAHKKGLVYMKMLRDTCLQT